MQIFPSLGSPDKKNSIMENFNQHWDFAVKWRQRNDYISLH